MFISLFHYGQSGSLGMSFSWKRMQETNRIIINPSKSSGCIGVNMTFSTYSTKHLQIINSRDLGIYFTPVFNTKAGIINKSLPIVKINKLPLLNRGVGFNKGLTQIGKAGTFTFTNIHQKYYKEGNARIYKQNLSISDIQDDVVLNNTLAILIELGVLFYFSQL